MGFFKARYVRDYMGTSKIKSIFLWIGEILAVVILGIVLVIGFGKVVVMQEGSMEPTLEAGDKMLVNRVAYRVGGPKRGDVIVFHTDDEKKTISTHIKRIVGLPGEKVQIKEGKILINGEILQEKTAFPEIENPGMAEKEMVLKSGEYFVLGDNRNNSEDSRFMDIGTVKKGNIIGKLWMRILPKEKIGLLRRETVR